MPLSAGKKFGPYEIRLETRPSAYAISGGILYTVLIL